MQHHYGIRNKTCCNIMMASETRQYCNIMMASETKRVAASLWHQKQNVLQHHDGIRNRSQHHYGIGNKTDCNIMMALRKCCPAFISLQTATKQTRAVVNNNDTKSFIKFMQSPYQSRLVFALIFLSSMTASTFLSGHTHTHTHTHTQTHTRTHIPVPRPYLEHNKVVFVQAFKHSCEERGYTA